jgi:PAS domain S-box-containing protein
LTRQRETDDLQSLISRQEEEIARLRTSHDEQMRISDAQDAVNQIIIGADGLNEMLEQVLQEFLRIFSCDRAWLLYPCDPKAAIFRIPMMQTAPQWAELESLGDIPYTDASRRICEIAIKAPGAVRFDAEENSLLLQEEQKVRHHIRSQMVRAIRPRVGEPWLLGIHHCGEPVIYSRSDRDLFDSLSNRIADGLSSLLASQNARKLFENTEVAIVDGDLSQFRNGLEQLRHAGVADLRRYLDDNRDIAGKLAAAVKIVSVNEAALSLFGAETETGLVGAMDELLEPAAFEVFMEAACAIWDKRGVFRSEASFRTLDGGNINVIISFRIPRTEDEFRSIPISLSDISERVQTERAQRESEARYRSLVQQLPDALSIHREGRNLFVNRAFAKLFGAEDPEDLIGSEVMDFVHPDFIGIVGRRASELKELGDVTQPQEQKLRRLDGSTIYVEVIGMP